MRKCNVKRGGIRKWWRRFRVSQKRYLREATRPRKPRLSRDYGDPPAPPYGGECWYEWYVWSVYDGIADDAEAEAIGKRAFATQALTAFNDCMGYEV